MGNHNIFVNTKSYERTKKKSKLVMNSSSLCSSIIFQENNINDGITRKLHIPIKQQYKMISTNLNSPILKEKPPITTTYNPTASEKPPQKKSEGGISWFSRTIKQFV